MLKIKKESDTSYTFSLQSESGQTLLNSIPFNSREEIDKTIANLKVRFLNARPTIMANFFLLLIIVKVKFWANPCFIVPKPEWKMA